MQAAGILVITLPAMSGTLRELAVPLHASACMLCHVHAPTGPLREVLIL